MQNHRINPLSAVLRAGGLMTLMAVLGCQKPPVPQPQTEAQLKSIYVLYGQYTGQHRGKSPPDEPAFKAFISSVAADQLSSLGVGDVNSLFFSPRDNQPFVIHYNAEMGIPGVGDASAAGGGWLAHEQTGAEGKQYVLFATGVIEEVESERLPEFVQ